MSKQFIVAAIAGLSLIAFSIFSLGNAFALSHEIGDMGADPLTGPKAAKKLCQIARSNYRRDIKNANAKGLSLQLSEEEIDAMVRSVKDYRQQVCAEAAALTSAVKLCKEAKKNYRRDVKDIKAKPLSSGAEAWLIRNLRDFRKQVCKEAKAERAGS